VGFGQRFSRGFVLVEERMETERRVRVEPKARRVLVEGHTHQIRIWSKEPK